MSGNEMRVVPLTVPTGEGFRRKIGLPLWFLRNGRTILREVRRADAVHTPIPGDIGTIGMVFALLFKKPLFVRHCGNWFVQRTLAERFWKWSMERFAGGRNVMLATGGGTEPPSKRNENIEWIFSTSLGKKQVSEGSPRTPPLNGKLRLVIACRQEKGKGTDVVIGALTLLLDEFPEASLDVIGGGSELANLKDQAHGLGLDDRVTFHGKIEQAKVVSLLNTGDLFCYPTASEGFPKVVIEALSCGLPVITTKVSVLPHLIGSGCGVTLEQVSPTDLAKAIRMTVSNEAEYARMSEKAIEVAADYTLEKWGEFILKRLRDSWKIRALDNPDTQITESIDRI